MAAEKNFENRIKKFLKEEGAWGLKYWSGGHYTKSGIPDLLCCINGQFLAVEVKAENGKPSELQLYTIEKIRDAGGAACVLYPKDFETFKKGVLLLKGDKPDRSLINQIGGQKID